MIILNWIPEIALLSELFLVLLLLNFKPLIYRSLCLSFSFITFGLFIYFGIRNDLTHFDSNFKILVSDSLSSFGRLFSLLMAAIAALGIHLHQKLTFGEKNRALIFILFFSLFLNVVFMSESLLLMLLGWLGCYFSVTNLILIESRRSEGWIQSLRQFSLPLSTILLLFFVLFLFTVLSSGSIYISDFVTWVQHTPEHGWPLLAMGSIIVLLGTLLIHAFPIEVDAPLGLAHFALFLFTTSAVYWFRVGVPFLNEANLLPKNISQLLLGAGISAFSLRHAVRAMRTRHHYVWLSASYFASVGIGLFLLLLGVGQALPLFFILSLSFLTTFHFVGKAFLETGYQNKIVLVSGMIAMLGMPPLVMGEQYFQLIHDTIEIGLVPIALVVGTTWFILSVATIQMLNKVILVKRNPDAQRRLSKEEILILTAYAACVITLTALKPQIVSLLNEHPISYLW